MILLTLLFCSVKLKQKAKEVVMNRSTVNWTAKKLYGQFSTNKATSENEIQRGVVWNIQQKSLFIHSLIMDYPVPPFYAIKSGRNSFDFIDGKQRSTAIIDFIDGKFALKDIPVIEDDDGETDITGQRYADLPEDFREALDGYSFSIVLLEGATQSEIEDIFYRLNNGTTLKANDRNYAKAISKSEISELCNHKLFLTALTKNALSKMTQRTIVIQSLIMLFNEEPCLDAKEIGAFMRETTIEPEDVERLSSIYDKFLDIYETLSEDKKQNRYVMRKLLSRGNIPTLTPFILQHGDDEKIIPFFQYFFGGEKGACINNEYTLASSQGSGHATNVAKRVEILNNEFNRFEG